MDSFDSFESCFSFAKAALEGFFFASGFFFSGAFFFPNSDKGTNSSVVGFAPGLGAALLVVVGAPACFLAPASSLSLNLDIKDFLADFSLEGLLTPGLLAAAAGLA